MDNRRFFIDKQKARRSVRPAPKNGGASRKPAQEINRPAGFSTPEYIETVRAASYLGKKGYTIPKSVLCEEDLACMRKDLYMRPEVSGPTYSAPSQDSAFPVFRENANKMYVPRFYGIRRYGVPSACEIAEEGEEINVAFVSQLRDYQERVKGIYLNHVSKPLYSGAPRCGGGGILELHTGWGKTVLGINIISELKRKTLIIVHKEFLMNQWIERIGAFMPDAKIGRIQGATFDIEGKDVVLGMLQTLYDRDFPPNAFSSFGFTIIDEVHHIGSVQFSKALLRIVTPYMLGISATVERKDGLTDLLYMFIGDKIHKEERKKDDIVSVRAIEYETLDYEFNEVITDYRGNTAYSSMISKLCDFTPRAEFIERVLHDLVEESPKSQLLVLSHNRSLLEFLEAKIRARGSASCGFYVGGMKQRDLDVTASEKQIVLSTYSMAAEALDIPSLSTLVLATPKTDVIQSVGRILRKKHDNPIIVDIVDRHSIFQNQWSKRRVYYKKCNYKIQMASGVKYTNMKDWDDSAFTKTIFSPVLADVSLNAGSSAEVVDKAADVPKRCLIQLSREELDSDAW
jgi:superfamily II DNA or RNA helicase